MFKRRVQPKLRVFGICPETDTIVPTYAEMTARELARFPRTLALFCPACRKAHQFDRAHLSLSLPTTLSGIKVNPSDA